MATDVTQICFTANVINPIQNIRRVIEMELVFATHSHCVPRASNCLCYARGDVLLTTSLLLSSSFVFVAHSHVPTLGIYPNDLCVVLLLLLVLCFCLKPHRMEY